MTQEDLGSELAADSPCEEEHQASNFLVFGAFGEVIFRFQVLELTFFSILAHRQKRGMSFDQRLQKLGAWDQRGMLKLLMQQAELPSELHKEALVAVNTRNYLVHRFMRERAPFLHDAAFRTKVAEELAGVLYHLDHFEARLEEYTRQLGIAQITDEDLEKLGLIDPGPNDWLGAS